MNARIHFSTIPENLNAPRVVRRTIFPSADLPSRSADQKYAPSSLSVKLSD